ncbi:MAG: type II secretion system protein [Clostridia bacterium]|nr:type II secretion system protein [Clostridia bacterium]
MLQKKSGFTLVELIVVIAISAIVLTMVGTTMVFMTNMSGDLLQEAEDIDMAKNIEKYLRSFVDENKKLTKNLEMDFKNEEKPANEVFKIENGNLIELDDEKTVFSDTGLEEFKIYTDNNSGFIKCYMKFDSGKEFEFILSVV